MSSNSTIILPTAEADRKAIMTAMIELDGSMTRAAAEKDYQKQTIKELSDKNQIDKKYLTKFARLYHKQSFQDQLGENEDFEALVITLVPSAVE